MEKFSSNRGKGKNGENGDSDGKNPALLIFDDDLFAELFNARCHDIGETMTIEKAKMFKDELMRINQEKNNILNLQSLRLGVNSIISLSATLATRDYHGLNIADNSISDYGMHAVKNIITNTKISFINLSSNMISEIGLEMLVPDLTKNTKIKGLDLGITEGSIRKNSLGIQGAKCLAAILLYNKSLETLKLQDNDLGVIGGELIGEALKQNKSLKHLKIAENDLKSEGSEHILKAGMNLESLDIGKNFIQPKSGIAIKSYIENNMYLQKLNLEFNELMSKGLEPIAYALQMTNSLRCLTLKGNCLRDEGMKILADALEDNMVLEELDVSLNEITPIGSAFIAEVLPRTAIRIFNISKNFLGDDAFQHFAQKISDYSDISKLSKLDFSSCRIGDEGILFFLKTLSEYENLVSLRVSDNFISEKIEKVLVELIEVNKTLVEFSVSGNRISLSCLSRLRKLLARNQKDAEEREPNKLKIELYRLQYEQKKILDAKDKVRQQEKEIAKATEQRTALIEDIRLFKLREDEKRKNLLEKIEEQRQYNEKKIEQIQDKTQELEKLRVEHEIKMTQIKVTQEGNTDKKKLLKDECEKLRQLKTKMEDDYLTQINDVKEQIANKKKRIEELKKKEQALNEEFRTLK